MCKYLFTVDILCLNKYLFLKCYTTVSFVIYSHFSENRKWAREPSIVVFGLPGFFGCNTFRYLSSGFPNALA